MGEVQEPLKTTEKQKYRPLTPFRVIRGVICLVVFVCTAFFHLVYFAPLSLFSGFFTTHYRRKVSGFLFSLWLSMWPFLFEKINGTKIVFSGDPVPEKERVLIIANHRTEVDWMYLWNLALRKGGLPCIKYMLKSSLMKLPIFGWAFHSLEFISVERKWENDEPVMRQVLSSFKDPQDSLWLALFPEGTDYTEQKCLRSQKFAAEVGLPVLKNVLLPKTRGFCVSLEVLRNSLDAVYDLTIAYKHQLPTFMDNVFGIDPEEVHIHIRRIPVEDIPESDTEATTWLMNAFELKDELLSDFRTEGHFPKERSEAGLSTLECVANFAYVMILTAVFAYLTFYSSIWFKIYVVVASGFLTLATHLKIRPLPVLGSCKQM
ncbi:lysophosphatidyl acyltransferase 4 [Euphorbia peplus]|nr:lysophosphatidyl acyltransferase 4 [Euphorbia peplus]